ncbi:hypothetical protein Esi_0072_0082 [Ectocarpus siliculosus]|uniref:PDZ domain-containing protein n=1 Tax=Ectocarpus siliculosus TaxID=2880 RepID=D8LSG0_ECTSI|nr:hypothetical protein Esi_0072_0082 [Ectocarpus siliculosus]|eukprot:CBN75217.1 hypothetical protein Esi_0072_0082 [Ectocarpus siliculosus]
MSSPRKRHRKPTTQQPQPAPNVAKRIHVSLEEDKPIGLELDFSAEATTGVRVSHVNAGGAAESEGVEQEDRLIHVSGQDVREMGLVETREMLLRRAKTTLLVFERPLPPSPPPSPPRPRKNMGTKNARREKNRRQKRPAGGGGGDGGGGGNGVFSSGAQPNVSPVVAAAAAEAGTTWQRRSTAPAAAQRRRGYQQHRLYNSGGGDGGSGSGEEAPSTAEAAAALAALAGRGSFGAKAAQRAAQKRRRRKAATATAAVTPTAVDTDPKKAVGEAATAAEIETIRRQLEEEEDHEREMEGHRRQRAQQQPPPPQQMRQRRLAAEEARNGVGVRAPGGTGAEDRSETEEVEAQAARGAAAAVDTPPTTAAAAATASPPPPSQRHGKREGSRKPGSRSRPGEEETMAKTAARPQPRRPEDSGEGERNGSGMTTILASPRSEMPRAAAAAPAWLGVLVGLGMPEFAGTGAARASVVVREARDMEAKELAVLQRLQKLKPEVTLDDYTAFRGAGLRSSSPAYASLEALQGQYLRRPPEDHQQELADLAMNGSFVSDLLAQFVRGMDVRTQQQSRSPSVFLAGSPNCS